MSIDIFATRSDMLPLIENIEIQKSLQYSKTGLFHKEDISTFHSLKDFDGLGYCEFGNRPKEVAFIILEKKHKIEIRTVKQRAGGYLYAIDQLENPNSIVFQPPGIYKDKHLIMGSIGTASESKVSKELFRFFKKEIVRGFSKVQGFYIGPEAMKLAQTGVRLITMHIEQSSEYDLAITN